jgi:hypothetical protein
MKKTFGIIALLASSSLALVSPALAHDQRDNYSYRSQSYGNSYNNQRNNRYTTNDSSSRNRYVAGDSYARGNSYVVARDNDRRDGELIRNRQWQQRDAGFRDCR